MDFGDNRVTQVSLKRYGILSSADFSPLCSFLTLSEIPGVTGMARQTVITVEWAL